MQQCPKCGSGVSDDRTTCHICFAEIGPNAQTTGPAGLNFATPQSAEVTPEPKAPVAASAPAIPTPPPPARAAGIPGVPTPATPAQPQPAQGIAGMPALSAQAPAQSVPGLPGVYAQPQQDSSAAMPNYLRGDASSMAPQSMGGGEMRVSLTGEVIQGAAPTPSVSRMSGATAGTPPRPGAPPMPARRTSPARGPVREEVETQKSSGGGVFLVLFILMVVGGGGFGGWYLYNNRTNPKDQAVKVMTAMKAQDWAALYPLVAFSDEDKKKYPDAASFAADTEKGLSSNPQMKQLAGTILSGVSDVTAGEPTIADNKAEVPLSYKLSLGGMSLNMKGTAHMIKSGGAWKLDGTSQSAQGGFKLGQDLMGKPDMGSTPGGMSGMPGMMGGKGGK